MRYPIWIIVIVALLVASCGAGSAEPLTTETTSPAATTSSTTTVTVTTAAAATTTTAPLEERSFSILNDSVIYHEDAEGEWAMSVYYPDTPGPWPLVVVYHGMTLVPATSEARTIAMSGAVAVAPLWLKATPPTITREQYIDGELFDRAACAVSAAQQVAAAYDADPQRTTVAGFSAGVHPAAWVGLGIVRDDLCAEPQLYPPIGLILGDSQMLFYEEGWDEMLADPDSTGSDTLDRYVNPERWNLPDGFSAYLWTSDHVHGRPVENPPTADSWLWSRDTTGTLGEDLAALDAYDNEWIGWEDNGPLLELRLCAAGYEATHEFVGGGHNYSSTVYDAIDVFIHDIES